MRRLLTLLQAFNAVSAFNNCGMSLLDANMTAFQDSYFLLLSMGFFILAGNTAYPIFLRLIIWVAYKILPNNDFWRYDREILEFLLKHPRRCYTNLFPSRHTWWLGSCVVMLNAVDWAMFEILNIGNKRITQPLSTKIQVLDGFFQALAVRSGGFYVRTNRLFEHSRWLLLRADTYCLGCNDYESAHCSTSAVRGNDVYLSLSSSDNNAQLESV